MAVCFVASRQTLGRQHVSPVFCNSRGKENHSEPAQEVTAALIPLHCFEEGVLKVSYNNYTRDNRALFYVRSKSGLFFGVKHLEKTQVFIHQICNPPPPSFHSGVEIQKPPGSMPITLIITLIHS